MSAPDEYEAVPEREPAWQLLDRATSYRKRLLAAGYLPLPVNGKAPPLPAWQDVRATPAVIDSWSAKYAFATSTGVLTFATPAVDIDVLDAAVADEVQEIAEQMLGVSAVRMGKAPKRAMLYRASTRFGKIATPIFTSPDGRTHKVEVLCNGQQIVVSGIHPDTRAPYTWHGGEPGLELRRDALPPLTPEKAAEFIAAAERCMAAHGWESKKKTNGGAGGTTHNTASDRERRYALAALDGCVEGIARAASGEETTSSTRKHFGSARWSRAAGFHAPRYLTRCSPPQRLAVSTMTTANRQPGRRSSPASMVARKSRIWISRISVKRPMRTSRNGRRGSPIRQASVNGLSRNRCRVACCRSRPLILPCTRKRLRRGSRTLPSECSARRISLAYPQ
jgi:Bifunctional DNA primase/polymerase, N-terminal